MIVGEDPQPRRSVFLRAAGAVRLAGAALRQAFGILRSDQQDGKSSLALHLLRMKAKHLLLKAFPRLQFHREWIFGRTMECFDYFDLLCTFEIIFLERDYRFRPATPRPRILDCGSNIGLSLLYFKREFPECVIRAFEPDPRTFAMLQKNVESNGLTGIELHNLAVGGTAGPRNFFHDPLHPGSVSMSLLPEGGLPACEQVQGTRLSEFVQEETDFLKLDVEGAELEVIEDLAERNKLRLIREMVIEIHPGLFPGRDIFPRLQDLLQGAGFRWQVRGGFPGGCAIYTIYAERTLPHEIAKAPHHP
jgi:FkbM family methyltransferase